MTGLHDRNWQERTNQLELHGTPRRSFLTFFGLVFPFFLTFFGGWFFPLKRTKKPTSFFLTRETDSVGANFPNVWNTRSSERIIGTWASGSERFFLSSPMVQEDQGGGVVVFSLPNVRIYIEYRKAYPLQLFFPGRNRYFSNGIVFLCSQSLNLSRFLFSAPEN